MNMPSLINDPEVLRNLIVSAVYVTTIVILRHLVARLVMGWKVTGLDDRRRWIVQIRNGSLVFILFGLALIWADALKTFAISLVAIAAALVIATKELIMCFLGGVLRTSKRSFTIGDRIEVSDIRGDVIDLDFLTTTLLEIGPGKDIHQYTGRTVVIPNSILLAAPLINETATNKYVLHIFTIPVYPDQNWARTEKALIDAARHECSSYIEDARKYLGQMGRRRGFEAPNVEPRVTLHFRDPERLDLILRVAAPALRKGRIEQAILRRALTSLDQTAANEPPVI